MATSNPHLFTARHIDRLPGPFVKVLTVSVLFLHGILVALALRSTPLAELGGNGGGDGSGSSTLYVSVVQGQPSSYTSSITQRTASAEKSVAVREKSRSGLIITTQSPAKRTAPAVQTVENKGEQLPQTPVTPKQITDYQTEKASENGSGSHVANGVGNGTGGGSSPGSGQGEGNGNSFGHGGSGSGPARSVSLSQLKYKHAFKPEYPSRSIQRHESGQVNIQVVVDTAGHVHDARVISSSGFDRLDESALKAARRSTFYPYVEHGKALFAKAVIPYRFNLNKR